MSQILSCPKCGKAVLAPEPADVLACVRCPACSEKYLLQTALAVQPPALEFISQTVEEHLAELTASTQAARIGEAEFPTLPPEDPGSTNFPATAQLHPNTSFTSPPLRKRKNPIAGMLKIMLGGFAGLILGYAVLLWGFRRDPFDLARFLPDAVVPAGVARPK
jgi:DNA-directed RNA polymerase subunit RPC12/RpoP